MASEPINGNYVQIAFSSIAFEEWFLMHFEKNTTAFIKSECKDGSGRHLRCGSGDQQDDCWGGRCVVGYMRTRTYLFCSTKSGGEDFNQFLQNLVDRRITAYENAAWLRYFNNQKNIPIYDQNPYTDVDRLVKRMLGEESLEIEWTVLDIEIIWNSLDIQLTQQGNEYQLNIQNLGSTTRLINDADIRIVAFDEQGESACFQDAERPITISPGKACTLTHQIEDLQGKVLKIQSGNSALCINIM